MQTIHFALIFSAVMGIVMLLGTRIGRKMDRSWRGFAGLHGLGYLGAWHTLPSMTGTYHGVQVTLNHKKIPFKGWKRIHLNVRSEPGLPPRFHFHVLTRPVPGLVIADQGVITGVAEVDGGCESQGLI